MIESFHGAWNAIYFVNEKINLYKREEDSIVKLD